MKKVFFSPVALSIIPVDEVGRYSIIGFESKTGSVKGMLALDHSQTIGVTLVNGPADEDKDVPAVHPLLECSTGKVNAMMKEKQDQFDFYVFPDMDDLLMWLLSE